MKEDQLKLQFIVAAVAAIWISCAQIVLVSQSAELAAPTQTMS